MRIRTQFILTLLLFGIILVVIAASAVITHQRMGKTKEQEDLASHIAQGASDLSYLANDYLIYREDQQLRRWRSRFESFSRQVASLHADRPDQQALVRNIQANQQRLNEVFDSTVLAERSSSTGHTVDPDRASFQVSWSRLAVQSQGLVSDASRLSQLLHQQMDRITETRTVLLYITVGLFGALLLVSYRFTYRRILKSIAALHAGTAVVGSGNLDFKIEEKRNDEIGDLSHAFNRMIADLKGVTASKVELEREIAERKQAEDALRESEQKFRAAFTNAAIGFAMTMPDGRFVDANSSYCAITGYSIEELRTLTFPRLIHIDDHPANMKLIERMLAGEIANFAVENRYVRKDGQPVWVSKSVSLVRNAQGVPQWLITLIEDITDRRQAEEALRGRTLELQQLTETLELRVQERTGELERANEALRNLSARLLSAHEEERKRVAGEIHDVIGACLGAIKFKVEGALRSTPDSAPHPLTDSLKIVIPVIQEGIEECRRIQQDLRPSMLDDLGLMPTLSWFCRRFQTIYSGIRIEQLIAVSEEEIPGPRKIVLYRVVQEAMNNIAKHSKADLVRLSLQRADGRMVLAVEDNGRGFDLGHAPASESTRRGMGLTSMTERVEFSGGSFQVESAEGKGTTIRASWPI